VGHVARVVEKAPVGRPRRWCENVTS